MTSSGRGDDSERTVRLRVIDIETTGEAPPAEIIEIGRVDLVEDAGAWRVGQPMARLYRSLNGIPPEAMAVHHITEEMIDPAAPICSEERMRLAVWGGDRPDVLVAHNAEFERSFIPAAITAELPWICTYKTALRVWPQAPRHSNQVLRYWRGLRLDPVLAMPPHRAAPDAYVTAVLLVDLLAHASLQDMIAWTAEPKLLPSIPFGKHRGMAWSDAPVDYLDWVVRQSEMDADVVWNARRELERRGGAPTRSARRRPAQGA
jgi:exodeoxyribonuclease X